MNTRANERSSGARRPPTLSSERLAQMLGRWSDGTSPLHSSLAEALRMLIDGGQLPAMTRLPSERALARTLAVSRNTVVAAYDALRSSDLISSRSGSGTWVSLGRNTFPWADDDVDFPWRHHVAAREGLSKNRPPALIDLSSVALAALPEAQDVMMRLSSHDWRASFATRGYVPLGIPPLRKMIAAGLERHGIVADLNEVIVTSGAQQALELVVAATLRPGDGVAVEDTIYPGALPVFRKAGARFVPIPMDEEGMKVEELSRALEEGGIRLVYINPTFHNPCGLVMGEARRKRLAALVEAAGIVLVETTAAADLSFESASVPHHVAAHLTNEAMVTLGSMSSVYWSGLRIGWIRASGQLLSQLARLKAVSDLGNPVLEQMFALRLLERGDELRRSRRRQLKERFGVVSSLVRYKLPDWEWRPPSGGAYLWVRIPRGSATEFGQVALRHGVLILPGTAFSVDGAWDNYFRLPFVLEKSALERAVEYLAAAWKDYVGRAS